ncbi:MAG: T9SS type A sorting domain-containing protein, partial [Bacteroidota bacterium]
APIITSPTVNNITDISAVLGANVVGTGGSALTNKGIVWSQSTNPVVGEANTTVVQSDELTTGVYSELVQGLPTNVPIYFKGFATNDVGTSYTEEVQFTTTAASGIPTLTNPTFSNVGGTTATLGAEITANGGEDITEYGIVWGTAADPQIDGNGVTKVIKASEDFTGVYTLDASSLPEETVIYFRGYAINSVGTAYSNDTSFNNSTEISIPVLDSLSYTIQNASSVIVQARLANDGGATISEKGFVWDTLPSPVLGGASVSNVTVSGTEIGNYSSTLSSLPTGVVIFLRGYATNSEGTGYTGDTTLLLADSDSLVTETNITEFTATAQTNGVLLNWTAIEVGNQSFIIERSQDASIWQVQEEIEGAGTSLAPNTYTALDKPPFPGPIFYRIRFVVAGNVTKYSEVREVVFEPGNVVSAFPMPAEEGQITISVDYVYNTFAKMTLVDPMGRIMYEKDYVNQDGQPIEETLNVSDMQDGMYFVSFRDGQTVSMKRILIYSGAN